LDEGIDRYFGSSIKDTSGGVSWLAWLGQCCRRPVLWLTRPASFPYAGPTLTAAAEAFLTTH